MEQSEVIVPVLKLQVLAACVASLDFKTKTATTIKTKNKLRHKAKPVFLNLILEKIIYI
jgi:hypothetical protein